jgi:hypothetical protein
MALPLSPPFVHPQSTQAPARWQLHQHRHLSHHRCYGRSTVVSDLDGVGVCPECQMAEVGKRLDYNGVRITERWINTQGESACQALKRMEGRDSTKYSNQRRMKCRDSTKYAQERMYRGCCRGSTKYTTRTE